MSSRSLRAVKVNEKRQVLTVDVAAESGSHRDLLAAMRTRIARTVADPECPPRDLAALTRRLQDIAREIDALDQRAKKEAEEDGVSGDESWDASAV